MDDNNAGGKGAAVIISIFGTFLIAKGLHASTLLAALITVLVTTAVAWWALRQ